MAPKTQAQNILILLLGEHLFLDLKIRGGYAKVNLCFQIESLESPFLFRF